MPKRNSVRRFHRQLKGKLFFGGIISTVLEAYIEIVIAVILNYQQPIYTTSGEIINIIFLYFIFSVGCILVPLAYIYVIW